MSSGRSRTIGKIGEYLFGNDIFFIVDGAQTAGQIPVDLGSMPCDVFAFTGHKALFGIPGIGGFFIRDSSQVDPVRQGGTGANSGYPFQEEEMPSRFEAGTHNYPGIASLHAGIRFLQERGIRNVEHETMVMTRLLISRLKSAGSIIIDNEDPDLPLISFNVAGMEPDQVGFILARIYGIICQDGPPLCPPGPPEDQRGQGFGPALPLLPEYT